MANTISRTALATLSICLAAANWSASIGGAAEAGGHLRIGFENNRRLPGGRPAKSNSELVSEELKLIAESKASKRPIASADWIRKHLANQPA